MELTIQERVSNGCRLLTEHFGNDEWVWRVNLEGLLIRSCRVCTLGQLFGNFDRGCESLNVGVAVLGDDGMPTNEHLDFIFRHGLGTAEHIADQDGDMSLLTAEWRRQITVLRQAQALEAQQYECSYCHWKFASGDEFPVCPKCGDTYLNDVPVCVPADGDET